MKRLLPLVLLASACATSQRPSAADPVEELAAAERALARELAPAADARPVDCNRAALLRDNICTLATRICNLSPPDAPRCRDARASCQSARTRVTAACEKTPASPPR
jgi:hypothetical protein